MAGPVLFRPSSITSGLVGYWKLDEASGSRADSSGNGNTLTDNNTVASVAQDYWKTGENSADFESGNSEYLSRTSASCVGLDINGASAKISFSGWFKNENTEAGTGIIAGKWVTNTGWMIEVDSTISVYLEGTEYQWGVTTSTIANKWTHLAFVFDSTTDLITFYVNGNVSSVQAATTTLSSNAADFQIGNRSGASVYLDGVLKDIAVWNVALTPIQIKSIALGVDLSLYTYRPNNVSTAPTHYYKLNELSSGAGAITRVDSALTGGINLTDNNTVTTLGGYIEGSAARFTSANSEYLSGVDTPDYDFGTGDYTVCWWMNWTTVATARIFALGQYSSGAGIQLDYVAGTWTLYNNGNAGSTDTFSFTPVAGVWYFMTLRRLSGNIYLHIDTVQIGTSANTDNIAGGTAGFTLAVWIGTLNSYYDGRMADFAWWKGYSISDAEMQSLACGIPLQQTGIVSYWKLDETSGTRADSIGANNLTDNNTVLSGTGKVSNAADFERSNSEYLSISDGSQSGLDILSDLSFVCWINPETTSGIDQALISKNSGASANGLELFINGSSSNQLRINLGASTVGFSAAQSFSGWAHVVAYLDGANGKIYRDSANIMSAAFTTVPTDSSQDFTLGNDYSNNYFDGLMDEVLIAKRWFRDEEIKTIYCKGLAAKELTSSERSLGAGAFFLVM